MESSAAMSQRTFGLRPQGLNVSHDAPPQSQGPPQPAQGPYGSPGPGQQHELPPQPQKPYFYVQPSQSYVHSSQSYGQPSQSYVPMQNMQWHMPVSYNPYYGYAGLNYSMPAMNPYAMNAYGDPPGYVVPQTNLHLMDYRRMLNPQYYQTLAYHSRRFHYQHNSAGREMISSEVQTEPLTAFQRSSASASACGSGRGGGGVEAHNGFPHGSQNCTQVNDHGPAHLLPQAQPVKTGDGLAELKKTSLSRTDKAPQKRSFVIQTEEVRIECCSTAVGLEVLRSPETQVMALAHCYAAQDLAHCSSVIAQSDSLQEAVATSAAEEQSVRDPSAAPDVLAVDTASSRTDGVPSSHETESQTKHIAESPDSGSGAEVRGAVAPKTTVEQGPTGNADANVSRSPNDGHFKVLHMPFDLEALQSMETAVWSVEEMRLSSPDWLTQNTLLDSHMGTPFDEVEASCAEDLMGVPADTFPTEQVVPTVEMRESEEELLIELGEAAVAASAPLSDGPALADVCDVEGTSVASLGHTTSISELAAGPPSTADSIRLELELEVRSPQEALLESLPAYLPSTACPTDVSDEPCRREVPQTPEEPSKSQSALTSAAPTRAPKLNLQSEEPCAVQRPKAEHLLHKNKPHVDRRSVSDHECCPRRKLNENAFPARRPKALRLCNRCLANRSSCPPVSAGPEGSHTFKRKCPNPLQPWLQHCVLPTCCSCKVLAKKRLMRRDARSDVCRPSSHDAGGDETSENGSCRTAQRWWGPEDLKRRHQVSRDPPGKCPASLYPKLREKNCACEERCRVPGWEWLRRHPRGNATQDMDEENVVVPVRFHDKWGSIEKRSNGYKWKNEKSFTSTMLNHNMTGKDAVISQHLNVQKNAQPPSQGNHRKDTRC